MPLWSRSDVLDSKQYQLQLCQDSDGNRFFQLLPLGERHDASDVEVVAVTKIVPNALLKRCDFIAIAEKVTLVSGEKFFVDAHCIWFTQSEFHQMAKWDREDGNFIWSTSSPPRLPPR